MYYETKIIAKLLYQGTSKETIKIQVIEENLLQLPNKDRAQRFYIEIVKRLSYLDDYLLEAFVISDSLTAKAILLYTLLKRDRLFFEWMREIVFDKFLILDYSLSKRETDYFIERKSEQSDTINKWTDITKNRLIDGYHQVLRDSGMLMKESNYLQPFIIDSRVESYLIQYKEKKIVEILLGEFLK